jgi:hypothetical protein
MIGHSTTNTGAKSVIGPTQWNQGHTIGDLLTNANASTMPPGTPVYLSASGAMDLAKADNATTAECIGLAWLPSAQSPPAAVPSGTQGLAQEVDSLTLTTAQWDAVTGGSGGLTPGARYFVSQTVAGRLVLGASIGSTAGTFDVSVGRATSSTTMRLRVADPIGN